MPKTLISRSIFMARSATVKIPGFLYLVIFIGHCMDTCWGTSQRRDQKEKVKQRHPMVWLLRRQPGGQSACRVIVTSCARSMGCRVVVISHVPQLLCLLLHPGE